jgi:MbtH protein
MHLWPGESFLQTVADDGAHAALWPVGRPLPAGWKPTGYYGPRQTCLAFLRRTGTYRPEAAPAELTDPLTVPPRVRKLLAALPDDLHRRGEAIAGELRGRPGGPPDRIVLDRSQPATLLGALAAGSVCVIEAGSGTPRARDDVPREVAAIPLTTAVLLDTADGEVCYTEGQLAANVHALAGRPADGNVLDHLLSLLFDLAGKEVATVAAAGGVLGAPELPAALLAEPASPPGPVVRVRPAPGVTAHVLTDELDESADGDWGWLHLGSPALAAGYADGPAVSPAGLERLVPDPFAEESGRLLSTTVPARRDDSGDLSIVRRETETHSA